MHDRKLGRKNAIDVIVRKMGRDQLKKDEVKTCDIVWKTSKEDKVDRWCETRQHNERRGEFCAEDSECRDELNENPKFSIRLKTSGGKGM